MAQAEPTMIRDAVRIAVELDATELSRTSSFDEPFEIRFGDDGARWFGAFDDGARPGLYLARGLEGLRWLRESAEDAPTLEQARATVVLAVLPGPADSLDVRSRQILARAGVVSDVVAEFVSAQRARATTFPDRAEMRRILTALRVLVAVAEHPLLSPATPRVPGEIPRITVSGDARAPRGEVVSAPVDDPTGIAEVAPAVRGRLADVELEERSCTIDIEPYEGGVVVIAWDVAQGLEIGDVVLPRADEELILRHVLRGSWLPPGSRNAPDTVRIAASAGAERLREPLGRCEIALELVGPEELARDLAAVEALRTQRDRDRAALATPEARTEVALDVESIAFAHEFRTPIEEDRAAQDFIGEPADFEQLAPRAFSELVRWATIHRPSSVRLDDIQTQFLAVTPADDPIHRLRAAHAATPPSLWRVSSAAVRGLSVVVTDVWSGRTVEANLPEDEIVRLEPGMLVPMIVVEAGTGFVAWRVGPRFASEREADVLGALGATPPGPAPSAERFGRLWTITDDEFLDGLEDELDDEFDEDEDEDEFEDDENEDDAEDGARPA